MQLKQLGKVLLKGSCFPNDSISLLKESVQLSRVSIHRMSGTGGMVEIKNNVT